MWEETEKKNGENQHGMGKNTAFFYRKSQTVGRGKPASLHFLTTQTHQLLNLKLQLKFCVLAKHLINCIDYKGDKKIKTAKMQFLTVLWLNIFITS